MSKAPLVALEGKLGKFGHPRTLKVAGTGHLTKTKGHYMLHAAITASEAARLEEAARKVPAEEEAHTREEQLQLAQDARDQAHTRRDA